MNTEQMEMKEREISLVDLIADILLHWRTILIVMVIGGVLIGGLSYVRSAYTMEAQKAELEAKEQLLGEQADASEKEKWEIGRQLLEEQLTTTQISNVSAATWCERLYEQRLEYKQQSVLMQIDPQQVQRGDITFLIQTDIM
jgi:hypothetical protein